jgi:hypothetical protein
MTVPTYYTAATESGRAVVVAIEPRGADRAIVLNGVRMRSVYEPATVIKEAKGMVETRFGVIRDWRAVPRPR